MYLFYFIFQFRILRGMLESIRGLCGWHRKDCKMIYRLWKGRIVKQDESNGDLEFTMTIGLGGNLASFWKSNRR
jgi:hypothetical protein